MIRTLRRTPVATALGLVGGLLFVAIVGQELSAAGAGIVLIAAFCVAVAAAAGRLLRSWPFAVAFAVSAVAVLGFFAWVFSGDWGPLEDG